MRFWIGVTDDRWFRFLATRVPDEVNFWNPGGQSFKAVEIGAPFLFKLHSPNNKIVGGGFFVQHRRLPLSFAWDVFREKNGVESLLELRRVIQKRRGDNEMNPVIGCTILAEPFFFRSSDWIDCPSTWSSSIQRGKTYDTDDSVGFALWEQVRQRLSRAQSIVPNGAFTGAEESERYGAAYLTRARLGQGTFRTLVTEAYSYRCAITGEKTLPALEAAHIKPFKSSGPNHVRNGLCLRADLHNLFDDGYVTITSDFRVEVSQRIHKEFHNGRDYYALSGSRLVLPARLEERPAPEFVEYHQEHVYLG